MGGGGAAGSRSAAFPRLRTAFLPFSLQHTKIVARRYHSPSHLPSTLLSFLKLVSPANHKTTTKMARAALVAALVAAVAFAAAVSPASANAQLCNPGLTPAQPTNVRVKSNVWNGKNAGAWLFFLSGACPLGKSRVVAPKLAVSTAAPAFVSRPVQSPAGARGGYTRGNLRRIRRVPGLRPGRGEVAANGWSKETGAGSAHSSPPAAGSAVSPRAGAGGSRGGGLWHSVCVLPRARFPDPTRRNAP